MRLQSVDSLRQTRTRLIEYFLYIENWSARFDIYILLRTVPAVLFTREAYR